MKITHETHTNLSKIADYMRVGSIPGRDSDECQQDINFSFGDQVSLCSQGWLQICDPPVLAS
jgi:hypothetical protein